MLRFFQRLADPFQSDGNTQPPASVWAYLVHNLKPFRAIIAVSLLFTLFNAGIEVWLIGYAGTLVDRLFMREYMRRLIDERGAILAAEVERA